MPRNISDEERIINFFTTAPPPVTQSMLRTIQVVLRGRAEVQEYLAAETRKRQDERKQKADKS